MGCAHRLPITSKVYIGMTKEQVLQICGRPYKMGAYTNPKTGEVIEGLTYKEYIDNWRTLTTDVLLTHIYLKDGKIIQYGEPGDWMTEADYEGERKIKITTDEHIKNE